jgi:hypothetical protein
MRWRRQLSASKGSCSCRRFLLDALDVHPHKIRVPVSEHRITRRADVVALTHFAVTIQIDVHPYCIQRLLI